MIKLQRQQIEKIIVHARAELPHECCGLIGGRDDFALSVYRLRNVAANPLVEYEAAIDDLFLAHYIMREQNETLLGIYHSHPNQIEPQPSKTDVAQAFYPDAIYFIVGFAKDIPVLRAFKIYESERRWETAEFLVID